MLSRQDVANNFTLNVEKERLKQKFTQEQMAKKLGLSLSGYKKMISGATTKIDLYTALLLHNMTGKWLFELVDEPEDNTEFLMKLRELSPYQKKFLHGILDFELSFSSAHEGNADDYITVFVPTGSAADGMICDFSNWIKVNASSYRKKFGDALYCGIKVTSNHLNPVYNLGDILLICNNTAREGENSIFFNKETGRLYVRKTMPSRSWILEPINGYGETFFVNSLDKDASEKWIHLGYVLDKMRE